MLEVVKYCDAFHKNWAIIKGKGKRGTDLLRYCKNMFILKAVCQA